MERVVLDELSGRDPGAYPPQKEERRYEVDSQYVPILGPISIEVEKKRIIDISEEETRVESPILEEAPPEDVPSDDEGNEIEDDSDLEIERPDWGEPSEDGVKEEGEDDEKDGE